MSYRGEDLDLRTPRGWGAGAFDSSRTQGEQLINGPRSSRHGGHLAYAPNGPIWVDETVLDCCNYAYDIAAAHRAREVRTEHLLLALTCVNSASEVLEARGIRVAALRREAANAVAGDGLPSPGHGTATPQRSDAFEELLRLAAAHAYRNSTPVAVEDIVQVIVERGAELPGFDWLRSELQRMRGISSLDTGRQTRTEFATTGIDTAQNARLESLEMMVRSISTEFANERKILSGVLQELQQEVMAHRDDTSRYGGTHERARSIFGDRTPNPEPSFFGAQGPAVADAGFLHERIVALERAMQAELSEARRALDVLVKKPDPVVNMAPLAERLDVVEEAVLSRDTVERIEAVSERLSAIEALAGRLPGIEENLQAERERSADVQDSIANEIRALSSAAEQQQRDVLHEMTGLEERTNGITHALEEHVARSAEGQTATAEDLRSIKDAIAELASNQEGISASIQGWRDESNQIAAALADRLDVIEQTGARQIEMQSAMSGTVGKMHRLAVDRYYRRNRFWYWLFGTDDWIAASWPSQSARIAEDLEEVNSALKR
jgi:archaellum component FlaC